MSMFYLLLLLGLNIIDITESAVTITTTPADSVVCIGGDLLINCSTSIPGITAVPCLLKSTEDNMCEFSNRIIELNDDNLEMFMLTNISMEDRGQTIRCQSHVNGEYSQHSVPIDVIDGVPALQEFTICIDGSDLIITLSSTDVSNITSDYKVTVKYDEHVDNYTLQLQDSKLTLDGFFKDEAWSYTDMIVVRVSAFIQVCPSLLNYATSTIAPSEIVYCSVFESSSSAIVSSTTEIFMTPTESLLTTSDSKVELSSTSSVPFTTQYTHTPDQSVNPDSTSGESYIYGACIPLIIIVLIVVIVIIIVCKFIKRKRCKTGDRHVNGFQNDANMTLSTIVNMDESPEESPKESPKESSSTVLSKRNSSDPVSNLNSLPLVYKDSSRSSQQPRKRR